MWTVQTIVNACGGREALAAALGLKSADAIRKWEANGIPQWHWPTLIERSSKKLRADDLLTLNDSIRRARKRAA